jgi:hypothetical protein
MRLVPVLRHEMSLKKYQFRIHWPLGHLELARSLSDNSFCRQYSWSHNASCYPHSLQPSTSLVTRTEQHFYLPPSAPLSKPSPHYEKQRTTTLTSNNENKERQRLSQTTKTHLRHMYHNWLHTTHVNTTLKIRLASDWQLRCSNGCHVMAAKSITQAVLSVHWLLHASTATVQSCQSKSRHRST